MKPIIICGYSNTGKTTFIKRLIRIIKERGHTVAVIKHIDKSHVPKLENSDTTTFFKAGADVSLGCGAGYILRYEKKEKNKNDTPKSIRYNLHQLLMATNKDFVLIEGFKSYNGPIPKIVFGNSKDDISSLVDELTIAYSGINATDFDIPIQYLPYDLNDEKLYDFINENCIPFVADLDCGECGYPTCRAFAKALIKKEVTLKSCIPMSSNVKLIVKNKQVYLKGFVRDILRDIIIGFVKNLHDYEEGDIKITIKKTGID